MKVLLDEMLPIGLRELRPDHEVVTASYAGLARIPNGDMLDGAVIKVSNHYGDEVMKVLAV